MFLKVTNRKAWFLLLTEILFFQTHYAVSELIYLCVGDIYNQQVVDDDQFMFLTNFQRYKILLCQECMAFQNS